MRITTAIIAFVMAVTVLSATGTASASDDFTATGCEGHSDSVARLYTAGLDRPPEQGGFDYWLNRYENGVTLLRMSAYFIDSPEFRNSYGTDLTQDQFIRQLYRNVLGREGEQSGVTFWNGQMSSGVDRPTVLLRFAESPENITNSGTSFPTLGAFNNGLPGPWVCSSPTVTPPPFVPAPFTPALPIGVPGLPGEFCEVLGVDSFDDIQVDVGFFSDFDEDLLRVTYALTWNGQRVGDFNLFFWYTNAGEYIVDFDRDTLTKVPAGFFVWELGCVMIGQS